MDKLKIVPNKTINLREKLAKIENVTPDKVDITSFGVNQSREITYTVRKKILLD